MTTYKDFCEKQAKRAQSALLRRGWVVETGEETRVYTDYIIHTKANPLDFVRVTIPHVDGLNACVNFAWLKRIGEKTKACILDFCLAMLKCEFDRREAEKKED